MRLRNIKNRHEKMISSSIVLDGTKYLGKWSALFGNDHPIYIEIGMGRGDFLKENALQYPHINFIGIEKFDSVILRAYDKTKDLKLNNLKLLRMDATNIDEVFDKEISLIYLNFSDPWPKNRHHKRRLTSPEFLKKYDLIFKNEKKIILKTDNDDLFAYSLETLKEYGYHLEFMSVDYHDNDDIMTEYEKKFRTLGIKINKLIATK